MPTDAIQSKKSSKYAAETVDEVRPRRKRPSIRRQIPIWFWLLIVAVPLVLILVVVAASVGGVVYYMANRPQALLIGTWKATAPVPGVVVEFHREGTMVVRQDGVQASTRYRMLDDTLLELEVQNPGRPFGGMLPRFGQFKAAVPETVKVNATILTLTRTELVIRINDVVQKFQRSD